MQTWRDGWARATEAADALRAALAALGLPEAAWNGIRPHVTQTGRPYVDLGTLQAHVVEQIAEAVRAATVSVR
ncbi:hypothetical protein [Streptomyces sp. BR123]|uniref:hypothetical protein n=1 Tax=Streptomyces sp. BR123 TaxID=2749828 RepID=UPI001C4F85E7|nr:hypothetical protein [Streptomyces sp. BR123]